METYVAVRLAVGLLALGGRADPDPGRQVHAGHRDRGDRPLPARRRTTCSACDPRRRQRAAVPDLAGDRGRRSRLAGKKPGAGWEPQLEELAFAQQPGLDMRPYDRLIGAALDGDRWLFARQDTVEAAWQVVDPVLGDVVPVHPYPRGSWGPPEADALLPDGRRLARPGRLSGHPRREFARNIGSTRSVRSPLRPPRFAPGCPTGATRGDGHRGQGRILRGPLPHPGGVVCGSSGRAD